MLEEKSIFGVTTRCEEMVEIFADLSKDDTIEKIRHPATNSLRIYGGILLATNETPSKSALK